MGKCHVWQKKEALLHGKGLLVWSIRYSQFISKICKLCSSYSVRHIIRLQERPLQYLSFYSIQEYTLKVGTRRGDVFWQSSLRHVHEDLSPTHSLELLDLRGHLFGSSSSIHHPRRSSIKLSHTRVIRSTNCLRTNCQSVRSRANWLSLMHTTIIHRSSYFILSAQGNEYYFLKYDKLRSGVLQMYNI